MSRPDVSAWASGVSVIVPTFNRSHTLRRCLDSVLAQTLPDFELIVIDDGSVDDTPTVLKSFDDPRLVVVSQPNGGASAARNRSERGTR